ncbi:hypothetical protein [Cecembia calidifontis]|uniref:CRISPR-associated protein Csx10 n=1 Tax=Cecembia calidifontis TaxID=1187080 RepID=A0A4Q7PAE2_9BACT|nr:hypothetical protein [Cecembia calidifontis]RZS97145.1 hypothetical protein BC751_2742 [Cecembia calidifontis]
MKIYQYTCTLESDLIISSKAATEGQSQSLDYIPGSKFLGIVAKELYNQHAMDIFHNGKVSFGNAYPRINGDSMIPVPAAFFFPKGKSLGEEILLPMNLKPNAKYIDKDGKEIQPKQARGGYFNWSEKTLFTPEQNFKLKSAFDSVKRKSADGQMFGYFSLPKGLNLYFTIHDSTDQYADIIKEKLEGLKQIGRSKSAEYGLVDIKFEKEISEIPVYRHDPGKEIVIYSFSDLCFVDQFGLFTATPSPKDLTGSEKNEIVWEKSQVRSRKYPVWNGKRQSKDSDRIIIEKGSVFVVKINEAIPENFFSMGIGVSRSEGYGQVLVNPQFLPQESERIDTILTKKTQEHQFLYPEVGNVSESLLIALKNRRLLGDLDRQVKQEVDQFIEVNKKVLSEPSKSQWGTIRGYAKQSKNFDSFFTMTFEEEFGFINRGRSENQWRKAGPVLIEKIKNLKKEKGEAFTMDFIQKLSTEMPKQKES